MGGVRHQKQGRPTYDLQWKASSLLAVHHGRRYALSGGGGGGVAAALNSFPQKSDSLLQETAEARLAGDQETKIVTHGYTASLVILSCLII